MKYSDFLEQNKDRTCPFCSIKPDEKFLENESAFLTYALAPYHKDHLLVVTKRHFDQLLDATPEEAKDIDELESKGIKILHNLGYKNISIIVREGEDTGKSVEHIHYHIIPDTRIGDLDHDNDARPILSSEEIEALGKRIRSVIS